MKFNPSLFVMILAFVSLSAVTAFGECDCPDTASVIDFEDGLDAGDIVGSVSDGTGIAAPSVGDAVDGSVTVSGFNPIFLTDNSAMVFDADCVVGTCSGADDDLSFPSLGNALIISEDLNSSDPDDGDETGNLYTFDFSGWGTGTVTAHCMSIGDVESVEDGAFVEYFDADGVSLGTTSLPITGNNTLASVDLGGVSGVEVIEITLNGSGIIDNLCVEPDEEGGGEGCTPGYWKNHLEDWAATGLDPSDNFDAVFGVDLFGSKTLGEAVAFKGGGDRKLARHGTAALLSALHPDVDSPLSAGDVIAAVQSSDAETLVEANELGCDIP